MIVSLSSFFVNGLEQAQSAAFSGRSSGFFLWPEKSDRRKSSRSRDLRVPATSASPKIQGVINFLIMPLTLPPASKWRAHRNTPRPASRN